ncbi:MAG: flavodoxin [Bacteroidetes bacterium GWF2_43_63]|nr:MAG: flavodoxin [Bacteroidetes bacterium GWE2_42_42]OFY55263.1 MAG: flavodoxin [Bacteroidetes bacterium GWF2_43_63]HBG70853.1 flavodoxin [Bacteroidales bacterium]HCB63383.1 flavodoxin [Bacteroidales bacterium]HCY23086.1 flavodoxin [Bacteroidales bacterium]
MKTIVIYRSKTGFTKKYAEWIAEELGSELADSKKINMEMLHDYDTIIYGGGLYAGGINGVKLIKNNLPYLRDRNIIVFATGATPDRNETTQELFESNFNEEQQEYINFFYLHGGFDFSKLGLKDKLLMRLLKLKLRMIPESKRTPDETGMLAAYQNPADFTKKKYVEKLLELARQN